MRDLRTLPPERTRCVGNVMTNFDHTIDWEVAEALTAPDAYGTYSAWNFFGEALWREGEQFHCEIWRYHQHVGTISAESLEELMGLASDEWGAG